MSLSASSEVVVHAFDLSNIMDSNPLETHPVVIMTVDSGKRHSNVES